MHFGEDAPLKLDCGVSLAPFQIAYQTYGELNADKSNVVLICHALTLDQHVANVHPVTGKKGWWDIMVGPGLPIDTDRYFVICPNVVGGCLGSTGPSSTNPKTGKLWGLDFPVITIPDMVRAQGMLLDRLGIDSLFCVLGGSMGGMQVLQWATAFPQRVFSALPVATSTRHSAQNIAFHEVGRQAIMADPDWRGGRYFNEGVVPHRGLGVARMAGHITYLSDAALHRKFGRRLAGSRDADVLVRRRLRGRELFAPPRLVVRRAVRRQQLPLPDARDGLFRHRRRPRRQAGAGLPRHARRGSAWCHSPRTGCSRSSESRAIVHALNAGGARVSFAEIETDKGHDAFLLDEPEFFDDRSRLPRIGRHSARAVGSGSDDGRAS